MTEQMDLYDQTSRLLDKAFAELGTEGCIEFLEDVTSALKMELATSSVKERKQALKKAYARATLPRG
jgi:hypothetical protein